MLICACGEVCETQFLLIQHVEICPTADMLACIECGNVFKSKKQLNNHKRIHKEAAKCKECGKEMLNQNLPYHMKSKHNKDAPTYQCTECPYFTLLNNNLSRHKLVHNKENTTTECEKCSKMFSRPQNMRRHMDLVHSTGNHSHCPLCEKSFTRKENLKSHMLSNHATGKVSVGESMWGTFVNIEGMQSSDKNSFKCDQCVYSCDREAKLENHVKVKHTEIEVINSDKPSRATAYRKLKRFGEDYEAQSYMKKKLKHADGDQISDFDIEKMMLENPLMSNQEIIRSLQVIRNRLGKAAFDTNVKYALKRRRNLLEDYHTAENLTFEDHDDEVDRPVTFINDMNAFISDICSKRDHSEENLTLALGIDGGQGKLIITLTVSPEGEGDRAKRKEQTEKRKTLKSTGKRRAFVVARVDGVPENYDNLTQLLGTLNLPTLDKEFGVVCDLKVIDILVGLQSTSSRHSCKRFQQC